MAGTAENFRLTGRVLGPGLLWGGLAVPAGGAMMTLATVDANGYITPDATANPNAYAIGATKAGVICSEKATRTDFYADEIYGAIDTKLQQVEMSIQADLYGINDAVIATLLLAGFGTSSTPSGANLNTIGVGSDTFTGIALIAPMRETPTKVFVFHIYKAMNQNGMTFTVDKAGLAVTQAMFKGYAITTRNVNDMLGAHWWQT